MSKHFFEEGQTRTSRIKSRIVAEYFYRYSKTLLSKRNNIEKVIFLDLFCGTGLYKSGQKSTEFKIIDSVISDPQLKDGVQLVFNDYKNHDTIQNNFEKTYGHIDFGYKPKFYNYEVGVSNEVNRWLESKKLKNCLLFMDPFGYKGINTNLLVKFLANPGNEAFVFFNYQRINPGLSNPYMEENMRRIFPSLFDELTSSLQTGSDYTKYRKITSYFRQEITKHVPGIYYTPFKFYSETKSRISHFLMHFTKHPLGFEFIKDIMRKESGFISNPNLFEFEHNIRTHLQLSCFGEDEFTNHLANQIRSKFTGKIISTQDIYRQDHLSNYAIQNDYKKAFEKLYNQGHLEVISSKKTRNRHVLGMSANDIVRIL